MATGVDDSPRAGAARGAGAFHAKLREARIGRPEQSSRQFSVRQLYDFYSQGQLVLAELNRHPVWDATKQRNYVWTLIQGKVSPPLFVNYVRADNKRYIYDGGNRFHALVNFIEGRLHVHVGDGFRGCYAECRAGAGGGACGKCFRFDAVERGHFDGLFVDVFEWFDLPEAQACQLATMLNQGTPMNVAERLKLSLASGTHRAQFVRYVLGWDHFRAARSEGKRDDFLKALVITVRTLEESLTRRALLAPHYRQAETESERAVPQAADRRARRTSHG